MTGTNAQNSECWMKLGEAAFALGVSEITLRRRVKCGKLPHEFRDGKYYVMLNRDPQTGQCQEPVAPAIAPSSESANVAETERVSLLEQRVGELQAMLEEREELLRTFQRTIEDQETLIYLLERKSMANTTASSPSR